METALVTGGSSGIGAAIVERLAREGLVVHATFHSSATGAKQIAKRLGDRVRFHRLDLADPAASRRLASELPDLDLLVNNAGLGSATVRKASDDADEQDTLLMRVNALGPLWLTQAALPTLMARPRAAIINISSVGGGIFHFPRFRPADGMSKAALTYYTRQLAAELVHSNVCVFAVCPGAVDTPMFRASTLDGMDEAQRKAFEARLPKGRLIEPAEIAELCWELTKPAARVLHGAVLDASSGLGVAPGLVGEGLE